MVSRHLYDGDDGIRTHDPLLAGQVLSQLSYTPMSVTHRPLNFCSFAFTMNMNESSLHNRSSVSGFPSCKHDSLKIEQQHSETFMFPLTPI